MYLIASDEIQMFASSSRSVSGHSLLRSLIFFVFFIFLILSSPSNCRNFRKECLKCLQGTAALCTAHCCYCAKHVILSSNLTSNMVAPIYYSGLSETKKLYCQWGNHQRLLCLGGGRRRVRCEMDPAPVE